ncbi:unnamed protein product [Leptosia nina]|uniref:V-type proton ATPase subunit S1/VOA1 transmembrane domain-containing protein n=1 Tax=Leptosia nina TaxID=320188 RepID=A0AAV1JW96_9NEOP
MWIFTALLYITFHIHFGNANTVPVFVLDYESVLPQIDLEPNPFSKVDPNIFLDVIHETLKDDKIVVIFIEELLSTEDISIKDEHGSPFYNLKRGILNGKVKYFPKVVEPYKALKQVFQHRKFNVFHITSASNKIQIHNGRQKHFYIYFKDVLNETRANALRRHDLVMNEVYSVIKSIATGPVVAFYTGKINPIVIKKMNFLPIKPTSVRRPPGVTITSTGGLFRLIESVGLLEMGEEVGRTKLGVSVPWNHSYVCGEPLILVNTRDGSSVIISQYQIQPFHTDLVLRNASSGSQHCFGPAIHCGPYFNAQILSGLLVTFLFLGIITYGITTLYGCNSNDRYDNPQGKPLVIMADHH